jgi:hypothetical protein
VPCLSIHFRFKFRMNAGLQRNFKPNCIMNNFTIDISVGAHSVADHNGERENKIDMRKAVL